MRHSGRRLVVKMGVILSFATLGWGAPQELPPQQSPTATAPTTPAAGPTMAAAPTYVLGPDDVIAIKALDADEIGSASIRIEPSGYISLPMIGRLMAGGLTVEALEKELSTRLKTYVREPVVAVSVVEYRSQPVSVIGSVARSGVLQLEGRKSLVEILAQAGGLRDEAGDIIKITRKAEWGMIPLASAVKDPTGQVSVAEVSLKGIMQATKPEENILVMPNDVISVPRGDVVYVMGEVKRPGGFILHERRTVPGLQALALAEGFTNMAKPKGAMIVRPSADGKHTQIPANLGEILSGKRNDIELLPDDILFIPTNVTKAALGRAIQTAISATTSVAIHGAFY
jgi:polysaccharide biosynthesis/export protein